MTWSIIELCFAIAVLGVTIVLCELLLEVHKEIRNGNVEIPFTRRKDEEGKEHEIN